MSLQTPASTQADSSPQATQPHKPTPEETAAIVRKVATASFLGNFIEWFDYGSYVYFATVIATVFFDSTDKVAATLDTFAVFALSFFLRPIGAVVWGHLGDRLGRKWALSASIMLMSGATFAIGLIPSHLTIGIAAPILLLVFRTIQGFSASGEYAGAATFLAEYAPARTRGTYVSLVPASTAAGLLAGSVFASVLNAVLADPDLVGWGWRLPFWLAGPLGAITLYIRLQLEDSPAYEELQKELEHGTSDLPHPFLELFRRYKKKMTIAFFVACLNAVGFYIVLTYLPTYLEEVAHMKPSLAHSITSGTLVFYILSIFVMGYLSDHYGRKAMLTGACVAFIVITVPGFMLMGSGAVLTVVVVEIVLCATLTANDGTLASFLTETFPTSVRYTGFALSFNLANALFGGTAPFICTWLMARTGSSLAPGWYLVGVALVALVAIVASRDRSGQDLAHTS